MTTILLDAQTRTEHGTGVSRRLRNQGLVPGVLYGGDQVAVSVALPHNQLIKAQEQEAFYSQVIQLSLDDKPIQVIVKALQRHPYKPKLLHIDLMRVTAGEAITATVPIHFLNEGQSVGEKAGGQVHHHLTELELRALPSKLPEFVDVDIANLAAGHTLHLSDLTLPDGTELVALGKGDEHNYSVVTIHPAKGGGDDDNSEETNQDSE